MANTVTFYLFERAASQDVTVFDSLWYSIVSVTTIGYGDFSATSLGARIGTIIFVVVLGLAAFTTAVGTLVDWLIDFQAKERSGMVGMRQKDHVLIVNFPSETRVREIIEEFTHDVHHRQDEFVILSDQIDSLPFVRSNVSFVRGSPLEGETYQRANLIRARQAIVLSTSYNDYRSDSFVASVVSIIKHMNPSLSIVAECLSQKHDILFDQGANLSLVYTLRMANNLLVQEAQDPGVSLLTQAITSNQIDGTMASTTIEADMRELTPYLDVARKLLGNNINLIGVIRDGTVHLDFTKLNLQQNDSLVYIGTDRYTWTSLLALLE